MTPPRPNLGHRSATWLILETLETLLLVVTIYALVNLASARFIVDGDSMLPTFETGQFLIVSRLNYLLGDPERGDVVVFHYPLNPNEDFIKRVIGLPNDVVELRAGQTYVNGVTLSEPYIREACRPLSCPDRMWEVGPGQYFMMGDNRNVSQDSRAFGPVDARYLVGEALVRYWPPSDWGLVSRVGYPTPVRAEE